jgi:hypothetical protein
VVIGVSKKYTIASIFRAEDGWMDLQPLNWRHYVSPKLWYLPTSLHGVAAQKKTTVNLTFTENLRSHINSVAHDGAH